MWLAVNGACGARRNVAELIWPYRDIISILSRSLELKPGDVVMTGTPTSVGPVVDRGQITGRVAGLGEMDVVIGQPIARR